MAGERGNLLLRTLDRYAGIPLVRAAGLFRRRAAQPQTLRSVGVLCLGCIGDLVILSGPLADLAREHPEAHLTIFCSRANQETAHMVPSAAEVVVLPVKNPLKAAALVRRHGPFDAWLDASQWPRLGALLSLAARAGFKVGFMSLGQRRHHGYDAPVPHSHDCHELINFRQLFERIGLSGQCQPHLALLPQTEAMLPEGRLPGGPYAVLHMFPGGYRSYMKQWPEESWRLVAQSLLQRGLAVLLSGGPADHAGNESLVQSLNSERVRNLAGIRVGPTALLMQHAAVVVSVNTGIMHLAAAVGAPLVSLTGPVSVKRWGAVGRPDRVVSLSSPRSCAPCLHLGFEYPCRDNACMGEITVASVLQAVDFFLSRPSQSKP